MKIYLDSSAYLKGFWKEYRSDVVLDVMELCETGKLDIVISTWTLAECISVIDKACNNKRISSEEMDDTLKRLLAFSFNNERKGRLILVRPDWTMIEKSFAYIRYYHLSADDSLHAMCANIPPSDMMVLADRGFSHFLKSPEEPKNEQELLERPKIDFSVCNILNDSDLADLRSTLERL